MNSLANFWRAAAARLKQPFKHDVSAEVHKAEERKSNVIKLERVRDELTAANRAESAHVAVLERRLVELETRHDKTSSHVQELDKELSAARADLETTHVQLKLLEQRLEDGQQLYLQTVQETQLQIRRQDTRLSWLMLVSGLALLLAGVASIILVWDVQKNAGLLAGMSADIKHLMLDIGRREVLAPPPRQKPPAGAVADEPKTAGTGAANVDTLPVLPMPRATQSPAPAGTGAAATGQDSGDAAKPASDAGDRGQSFFAQNATMPGVISLPSGVQYRSVKQGDGRSPTLKDWVVVDYLGMTTDGSIFDNTYDSGQRAIFGMEGLPQGWQEPLLKMREGSEFEVYVPAGIANIGGIPSPGKPENEPGIYLIELIHVVQVGADEQ